MNTIHKILILKSLTKIVQQTSHIDGWTAKEIVDQVSVITAIMDRDEETINVGDGDHECVVPVKSHVKNMKLKDKEVPF